MRGLGKQLLSLSWYELKPSHCLFDRESILVDHDKAHAPAQSLNLSLVVWPLIVGRDLACTRDDNAVDHDR
jgi:hypothetical protein